MLAWAQQQVDAAHQGQVRPPDHAACLAAGGHIEIDVRGVCKACRQQVTPTIGASVDVNPWIEAMRQHS